jgi:site-specific DNA-methyltransferase (adenine-specific)
VTNEACGVKNAATRKYFTLEHLWYMPPPEMMVKLAEYATKHGRPTDRPYFSLDGREPISAEAWGALRYKWHHTHGLTNVWQTPPLHGTERVKAASGGALHANQKPLELMTRILEACTDRGDVIWEPFGGLCSAAYAAIELGRIPYAAETQLQFLSLARSRLEEAAAKARGLGQQTLALDPPS